MRTLVNFATHGLLNNSEPALSVCWPRRAARARGSAVEPAKRMLSGAWRMVIREWYLAPMITLPMLFIAIALSTLPRRWALAGGLVVGACMAFQGRAVVARGPWPDQPGEPGRFGDGFGCFLDRARLPVAQRG